MTKFKILVCCLVIISSIFTLGPSVTASSYSTGKAIIPLYTESTTGTCGFYISNITDNPIDVIITLYKADGSLLVDDNSPNAGFITGSSDLLNYDDQNDDSTLTFSLNGHCTGYFNTWYSQIKNYGYGVIQWKQNGNALQGLVAQGCFNGQISDGFTHFSININNGLPF